MFFPSDYARLEQQIQFSRLYLVEQQICSSMCLAYSPPSLVQVVQVEVSYYNVLSLLLDCVQHAGQQRILYYSPVRFQSFAINVVDCNWAQFYFQLYLAIVRFAASLLLVQRGVFVNVHTGTGPAFLAIDQVVQAIAQAISSFNKGIALQFLNCYYIVRFLQAIQQQYYNFVLRFLYVVLQNPQSTYQCC